MDDATEQVYGVLVLKNGYYDKINKALTTS